MSSEGTPLHGDRSAWNVVDFDTEHAKDISDSALQRHLPLPGAAGGVAQSDGTDWQRVNSLPLTDIASYARGYIIRGGSSDWEAYDANNSGFILVGDGTDIASIAFDWDTMAGGSGADMVHTHTSDAEGSTLDFDILTGDCDLADIAGYTRGYIIRGGASDWEAHDASTSGFILVGDGTDIASVCFDWDTMAGGASADMVHSHASAGEGGTLDHGGALTGLTDDDHTQYFLLAGETTDGKLYSGADLIVYSDAGSTEVARIDGATGAITTSSTVDGVDVAAHASRHNAGGADALGTVPNHDHTGDAGDGAQISHDSALADISADDHHSETHTIVSTGPHAETGLTIGHFLRATGAAAFSFAAIAAGDLPTAIDAAKIADGSVSNTEFQYLDDYATIGLVDLTAGEVNQLENIASTTISAAQWGYLGLTNQGLASTDSPTFNALTATSIIIGGNTITTTEWANLDGLNQTVATTSGPTFADVFLPDGGTVGISGNELLTVNAAGNFTFSGVTSVVVPDGCWIGADAACSWVFNSTSGYVTTLDKVGIGIATPGQELEINGDIRFTGEVDLLKSSDGVTVRNVTANQRSNLRVMPNGAVGDASGESNLEFFMTDYVDDATNWERLHIRANASANIFEIFPEKGGTGTVRPLVLYTAGRTNQLHLAASGRTGFATATMTGLVNMDQASTTATIPVLVLDQADTSEGTINFIASDRGVITGATNSLASVRVEIGGVVHRLALYVDA